MLSRSGVEAKNLMYGQTGGKILCRGAPQNDIPQNHADAVLAVLTFTGGLVFFLHYYARQFSFLRKGAHDELLKIYTKGNLNATVEPVASDHGLFATFDDA